MISPCSHVCLSTITFSSQPGENGRSAPEIQRNLHNFRKECHIPLQLTEPSSRVPPIRKCCTMGANCQKHKVRHSGRGGRQRKLCQALLSDNNLSDLAINVSKDKIKSQISWRPFQNILIYFAAVAFPLWCQRRCAAERKQTGLCINIVAEPV